MITTEHAREAVQALRLDEPLALIANVATLPGYERTQLGSALAGTGTRAVVIGSPDWAEEHGATALPDSYTPRQLIDALRPSGSPTVPRPTIEVPTDPVPAILAGHVPLPGLAPATAAIHRLLDNTEQGAVEITRVVMADPSVAGALLRQANSGRFEVSREIASVQEACVRLGNRMVVSLANEVLLAAALRVEGTAVRSIATRMLANFRATADLAEKMARSKGHPDPSEVRTAALLHNIGDVLLLHRAAAFTPLWESRGLSVEERMAEQSRAEHAELGAELLASWGLPCSLVQIARYQDTEDAPVRGDSALTLDVVRMAYQAALRAGRDYLPGQLTAAQ